MRALVPTFVRNVVLLYLIWAAASLIWGLASLVFSSDHHVADGWTGDALTQLLGWTGANFAFVFVYVAPITVAIVAMLVRPSERFMTYRAAAVLVSVGLSVGVPALFQHVGLTMWLTFGFVPAVVYGLISQPIRPALSKA